MSRKCSICTHDAVDAVNKSISAGKSFRAISRQFSGNDSMRDAVRRHTENCLKQEIQMLLKDKKIKQAIDHYQEISAQLTFAKELRDASRDYLVDPNDPMRLTLIPRAEEIEVIFKDYSDKTSNGELKKKRARLSDLLQQVEAEMKIETIQIAANHVDIRTFALNSIQTTDTVLDKIAKLGGLYTKKRENESALHQAMRAVLLYLEDYPHQKENLEKVISVFARGKGVDADQLMEKVCEESNLVN